MQKKQVLLAIMMVSAITLTGCFAKKVADDEWLAKINRKVVSVTDLQDRINQFPKDIQEALLKKDNKVKVLDQMINEEIIYQAASKSDLKQNEAYKTKLKEAEKQLENVKRQTLISLYMDENINSVVTVTDKEVLNYYNTNPDKFQAIEQRKAKHILVKTDQEAKSILSKIKRGQKFEKLAAQYSIDPTAKNEGDLGWFSKGQLVPEFEKSVYTLRKGRISGVVKTQFGYHIIKLDDIKVIPKRDFSQVKDQIKNVVLNEKRDSKTAELIKSLTEKNKVSKRLENIPAS
tara:strand:+ start:145 stop:1011 length:867 start_codon:yes stop_codon:yes gene_type:complete